MGLLPIFLALTTLLFWSFVTADLDEYPTCVKIFPEEPCFRDAEYCYKNLRSVNGHVTRDEEDGHKEVESKSLNSTIFTSCERLVGVSKQQYRQCLAMRTVR